MMEISITYGDLFAGGDVAGVDTSASGERLAGLVQDVLDQKYPDVDVRVRYDDRTASGGASVTAAEVPPDAEDVVEDVRLHRVEEWLVMATAG